MEVVDIKIVSAFIYKIRGNIKIYSSSKMSFFTTIDRFSVMIGPPRFSGKMWSVILKSVTIFTLFAFIPKRLERQV